MMALPGRIGLGGSRFCGPDVYGPPSSLTDCLATVRAASGAGVALIDTADSYGPGYSEEIIAAALAGMRRPIVATKVGLKRGADTSWYVAADPLELKRSTMDSLRRLRVDVIDLLQLHAPSGRVPIEESVGALQDLRGKGLVKRVGIGNVTLAQLVAAERSGPIETVQNQLNLATVSRVDLELLSYCERRGITFLAYQPLGDGLLVRTDRIRRSAERLSAHPAQLVLRALLCLSPAIVAIPGTVNPAHALANLASLDLDLDGADQLIADRFTGRALSGAPS